MSTQISTICDSCGSYFEKSLSKFNRSKKRKDKNHFCNLECKNKFFSRKIIKPCKQCNFLTERSPCYQQGNVFCSRSCSAKYNNTHKTHGTRRSKLEKWLEEQLKILYPNLEIHFNRKDTINSELDIYIPSLKLAFELNGIFHYEPIYGKDKLSSVQNNDNRKFQACLENNIELCIIDTSKYGYFKESVAKIFLDIIVKIINKKLSDI